MIRDRIPESISPKTKIITSTLIWGTVGIFVKKINLGSMEVAFFRSFIGSLFLLCIAILKRETMDIDREALKKNLLALSISGLILGLNWAALFQAIKYTTVSNATLSYYFAPIFMLIFSSILFKEKMTLKNIICILIALTGLFMLLKSGDNRDVGDYDHVKGIIFGLIGALLYAIIITLNRFIRGLPPIQVTLSQLLISSIVLLPIVIYGGIGGLIGVGINKWILVLLIGIIHTGFAYLIFFPSLKDVKAQTIAMVSYLDPITAIFLSSILLKESMTAIQILGGILILFSTYLNERE